MIGVWKTYGRLVGSSVGVREGVRARVSVGDGVSIGVAISVGVAVIVGVVVSVEVGSSVAVGVSVRVTLDSGDVSLTTNPIKLSKRTHSTILVRIARTSR